MLNQIVLVGRLTANPEVKEIEGGKKVSTITIACPRSYKNVEGVYETDFITCVLWNVVAENTAEYCKKGDIVGIKGRLQNVDDRDSAKLMSLKLKLDNLNILFDDLKPIIDSNNYNKEDKETFDRVVKGIKETREEIERIERDLYSSPIQVIAEKISFLSSKKDN